MDFSGLNNKSHEQVVQLHATPILKSTLHDGATKIFQDISGHAERCEITIPEGKVIIIKDYEKVPTFAHYKDIYLFSTDGEQRGSIDIIPDNRQFAGSGLTFYSGTMPIGKGSGNLSLAIANQLVQAAVDQRTVSHDSVDPEIITTIKDMLKK